MLYVLLPLLLWEGRLDVKQGLDEPVVLDVHFSGLASLACCLVSAASVAADHTIFITDGRAHPRHVVLAPGRQRGVDGPLPELAQFLLQIHVLIEPAQLLIKTQLFNVLDPSVVLQHRPKVQSGRH